MATDRRGTRYDGRLAVDGIKYHPIGAEMTVSLTLPMAANKWCGGTRSVASVSTSNTATTESGPPDHLKTCAQNAHKLRRKGITHCLRWICWAGLASACVGTVAICFGAAGAEPTFKLKTSQQNGTSDAPEIGKAQVKLCGHKAPPASLASCGFRVVARSEGPQIAVIERPPLVVFDLASGEDAELSLPLRGLRSDCELKASAVVRLVEGDTAAVELAAFVPSGAGQTDGATVRQTATLTRRQSLELSITASTNRPSADQLHLRMAARCTAGSARVRVERLVIELGERKMPLPLLVDAADPDFCPAPVLPPLRAGIQQELIEWDWRMQDGIDTPRHPASYQEALKQLFARGDVLIADLQQEGLIDARSLSTGRWKALRDKWSQLRKQYEQMASIGRSGEEHWEDLWRQAHQVRRQIVLANRLSQTGPIAFIKQAPSVFSHQLTQYYGACARPGGGVFVLEAPGQSMRCRQLAAELPQGSYQHLDVSADGSRLLFSFCRAETCPTTRTQYLDRYYHLYEVQSDGTRLRQLTDGAYDDFSPRYLPDGKIVFISTRRGGYHRCGAGPCPVYTLALVEADGSRPRIISYHETHEWDPAVLWDGRIIYTRWDYVDRHAVHYQQLWTVRPDGTDVRAYYGNNTLNPVGVWEAQPVPGSTKVMATAAAHHAMTAGSIILIDVSRGVDGLEPIERLTPDVPFPESEMPVARKPGGAWYAPVGVTRPRPVPIEALRWPGHCYRSAFPLSEKYFLAAYSFDSLIGEPTHNPANMFGIYLVDRFGNKELLYRDLNISSLWPMPLAPRQRPAQVFSIAESSEASAAAKEGRFLLVNVYESWPRLPPEKIARLRIVQVLPKTTPHINDPTVGLANASPGKQVLGTVPVEADGSAYFRAPAGVALSFQALDELGQAVQIMRSVTYLQPGETAACVGCHEPRTTAPPISLRVPMAARREPSAIRPGPDGAKPFSYPLLVQPVLDRHCVACHRPEKAEGNVVLTGAPAGRYTVSYNALAPLVPHSAWRDGDFRRTNSEPMSVPDFFGARGSRLMKMLLAGHEGVELTAEDIERLATWMDANALFYGTFDRQDQARQQRGQRIAGPALE